MGLFSVVICPKCGSYRLVRRQKSFKCFQCGSVSTLRPGIIIFSTDSAEEARKIIFELKARKAKKRE